MKKNLNDIQKRIEFLRDSLTEHNKHYYIDNKPLISDFEYDILMMELSELEKQYPQFATSDSPSVKVGSDLSISDKKDSKSFRQYRHTSSMLSLSNTYSKSDLLSFYERIINQSNDSPKFFCELKFDGTAISLHYENGGLKRAVTRGDGTVGDDVTDNVKMIERVPLKLIGDFPPYFEIRGEIFMPFESFDKLNRARFDEEESLFANPRNAAAGSLKLLDSSIVKERGLDITLYQLICDPPISDSFSNSINMAGSWGLPVSEYSKLCSSYDEICSYIDYWDSERKRLPFATDGVVIKVDNISLQSALGYTAKSPRWATAYKFKPEQALTRLISVDYQVGRTGAITPVANLEPVLLSGTIVKRASLHNKEQMDLLDIHIGDFVYVEKGGEIIPKITGVDKASRDESQQRPVFPVYCPDCSTKLVREDGEAKHFCPNRDGCPTQIKASLIHFCSRKAMNILAGEATIEQLYERGMVKKVSDLYSLSFDELITLDGWKERSAERFLNSLEESKKSPFANILYALGIRHIGETTAKNLAEWFGSIDALKSASRDDLLSVDEVGETLADSLLDFFASPLNIEIVEELKKAGLIFQNSEDNKKVISNKLEGLSIVISGNFSKSREEIKGDIIANGGKSPSSISASTSFLLAGDKSGPSKMSKAEKLGISIIDEDEFYRMIK